MVRGVICVFILGKRSCGVGLGKGLRGGGGEVGERVVAGGGGRLEKTFGQFEIEGSFVFLRSG